MTINDVKAKKDYEVEISLSEEYGTYSDCDEWGCAMAWFGKNDEYGVEYNFCIETDSEDGTVYNSCAIYKMEYDEENDYMSTDTSTYTHYEIDFTDEHWKEKLEDAMCQAIIDFHLS